MSSSDLTAFAVKVAGLFRGERDRQTWQMLLERLANEPRETAFRALDEYGLRYGGGPKSRFIASKFLAYLDDARRTVEGLRESERRSQEITRRAIEESETARAVEADWMERRREIEIANPLLVGEALDYLRSIGWGTPPADFASWGRTWILAVSDLVTGRDCPGLDPRSGSFVSTNGEDRGRMLHPVPARQFYRMAGIPPRSLS